MMNLLEKKNIRILTLVLIAMFFTSLLLMALFTGGRWDLNEQIAFGDRLANGFLGYSNGITDLFFPSSPYFPGVGFISYFYQLTGIGNLYVNNQLMLLTAVLIGVFYFVLLRKLTIKLYPEISGSIVNIILTVIYVTHFKVYMIYMSEFKPDTILLVIATISFFLLENDKKPTLLNLAGIGLLLFGATFFKQSFFLVFSLVFLLVFLSRFFSIKEKVLIIAAYGCIGLLALWLIFMIPNVYYFSVDVMGHHPMLEIGTIREYFILGIIGNIIFLGLFLFFLIKRFRSFSISSAEGKYFLFAIVWFLFSAISTAKVGGNSGNFEVGIIVFMPFVIYATDGLLKRFYSKKIFVAGIYIILIGGILGFSYLTVNRFNDLAAKIKEDNESIQFISDNFKNKKAFVDGNTYIIAEMSDIEVVTESETTGHFDNVAEYDFHKLKDAISSNEYDLFFLSKSLKESLSFYKDQGILKAVEENYTVYENAGMPQSLKGKILVPKKDK